MQNNIWFLITLLILSFNPKESAGDFKKSSSIIGIGEFSHGSGTDWEFRKEIIDSLLNAENGQIDILVEMPNQATSALYDFLNGDLDTIGLVYHLEYYGLCTNEFINFINYFGQNERIAFFGFDIQSEFYSVQKIDRILSVFFPNDTVDISIVCDSLLYYLNQSHNVLLKEKRINCINKLSFYESSIYEMYMKYDFNCNGCIKAKLQQDVEYVLQFIEFRRQHLKDQKMKGDSYYYRERCMAENIIKIYNYRRNKTVVLAANQHVLNYNKGGFNSMGKILKKHFRQEYYIICSQAVNGSILSISGGHLRITHVKPFSNSLISEWLENVIITDELISIKNRTDRRYKFLSQRCHVQCLGAFDDFEDIDSYLIIRPQRAMDALVVYSNVKNSHL